MSEFSEQCQLFRWAQSNLGEHPELYVLYAVPNGLSSNPRHIARQKLAGLKPGVPDIVLPVPRGQYHALYIELKVGKNQPSEIQKIWGQHLEHHGNKWVLCYGEEQAREAILDYLSTE